MESERPMDRLICGDVGYGKTEVAVRAAFKAILDGKQVAVLVPTTVLAQQHLPHLQPAFEERSPSRSRCSAASARQAQQTKIMQGLADGTVDLVVGTHGLLSRKRGISRI